MRIVTPKQREQLEKARTARWAKTPRIIRPCEVCSAPVRTFRAEVERGWGRFCSLTCKGVASRRSLDASFWDNVAKTDTCWLWRGPFNGDGYGTVCARVGDRRNHRAHRVAWELACGPIPSGLWVLHTCDNPPCVNPSHLFLGDRTANMQDCAKKRRLEQQKRPYAHNVGRKLSNDDVRTIRSLWWNDKWTQAAIGRKFNVTKTTINDIVRNRSRVFLRIDVP